MSNADLENLLYAVISLFGIGTSILIPLLFLFLFVLIIVVVFIAVTLITGFPLYKMAKNAGFKHPIYAFLPVFQTYLMLYLPQGEYNLFNWIVIKDRHKAAWIMTLVLHGPLILMLLFPILYCIPVLGTILLSLLSMVSSALSIAVYIVSWKSYFDLFRLYQVGENDIIFSVLSLIVPLFGIIMLFVIMNKEPVYGFQNIYRATQEQGEFC